VPGTLAQRGDVGAIRQANGAGHAASSFAMRITRGELPPRHAAGVAL